MHNGDYTKNKNTPRNLNINLYSEKSDIVKKVVFK